jgi:hypothetical protein
MAIKILMKENWMAYPMDGEGYCIITVQDIVEYLNTFPPQTRVHLDKDGWEEREIEDTDASVQGIIRRRGLFQSVGPNALFINN